MRHSSLLASALAVSTVFAACGDDSGDDDDSNLTNDSGIDGSTPRNDASIDAGPPVNTPDSGPIAKLQTVTLRFKGKVGNEDLECGKDYPAQGSSHVSVTPKDFRFYVEQIWLKTVGGEVAVGIASQGAGAYQANNVALVDLTGSGGSCSGGPSTKNETISLMVPEGFKTTGVRFQIGVEKSLNHGDPQLAPLPLKAPGASWDWTMGYRFLIAELLPSEVHGDAGTPHHTLDAGTQHGGGADAGGGHEGHGGEQAGLAFVHVGSTGCTKNGSEFNCTKSNRPIIDLPAFDPEQDEIVVDLGALFSTADLSTNVQCHGSGASCNPMFEALGVNIADGGQLPTQRVFRVE